MQKNASQFLKKKICLQGAKASPRSTYLLRSEIQMIIRTLLWSFGLVLEPQHPKMLKNLSLFFKFNTAIMTKF